MIQDLFDLSKASSATIAMELEQIDLVRLINQTLADMEEQINESMASPSASISRMSQFLYGQMGKNYTGSGKT